jgi:hypothetical protein
MSKTWKENPEKYKIKKKKKHHDSERMTHKQYAEFLIDKLSREIFNK